MIHFVKYADTISPRRGLIIERDEYGVWVLHIIIGFVWPKRRWFNSEYSQSFISAKPMYWLRLSLHKHTMPWFLSRGQYGNLKPMWIWAVFEGARGVMAFPDEEADRSRLVAMKPETLAAFKPRPDEKTVEDAFQSELERWRL